MHLWTNNQWINKSMNQWIYESMNLWIYDSMIQWFNESMNQWINESMNQRNNFYFLIFLHPHIKLYTRQSILDTTLWRWLYVPSNLALFTVHCTLKSSFFWRTAVRSSLMFRPTSSIPNTYNVPSMSCFLKSSG